MKKWLVGFSILLVLILVSAYVFIPKTIMLNAAIGVKASRPGLYRMLFDKANIAKWWPGKVGDESFFLNNTNYSFHKENITIIPVTVKGQEINSTVSLFLTAITADSTQLDWVGSISTSYNPVKRYITYLEGRKIRRDMASILQKMEKFYSDPINIYGIKIQNTLVTDSFLISTSGRCIGQPSNTFIYGLIGKLRNYASKNSAKESGYPMLSISTDDNKAFDVKVAIPVDKLLPSSGDILQKRMLGRGNILTTAVKGGTDNTTEAFTQIQHYARDYQLRFPAIPFYSLITDRTKEPDSSKWLTKIYVPIM